MKVIILSCNTGEGHNTAAKAIEAELIKHGDSCNTVDALGFMSKAMSEFICGWHVRIYRHIPAAFNVGYKAVEKTRNGKKRSLLASFLKQGAKSLAKEIVRGGYDTVVSVHPFSAYMYTVAARRYKLNVKSVFVATDYTCSPVVDKSDMDIYCIPHESIKQDFTDCFIPAEKLRCTGMPVRAEFLERLDQFKAKHALSLPTAKRHIMMMCGSMGCGPLRQLATELDTKLPDDVFLTVICGSNTKLKKELLELRLSDRVRVLGFTRNIPLYMDASELVITKAGGLSCSESLAKRLPMLLIDAVGGCETHNRHFFVKNGMAAETEGSLADYAVKLLSSPSKLREMRARMDAFAPQNPAEHICQLIQSIHREE